VVHTINPEIIDMWKGIFFDRHTITVLNVFKNKLKTQIEYIILDKKTLYSKGGVYV